MELSLKILDTLDKFASIQPTIDAATTTALKAVAIRLRDGMVSYSEQGHPDHPEVQTGRLKGSFRFQLTSPTQAVVGSDADYAPYVEFGHAQEPGRFVPALGKRLVASSVKPYPFARPAIDDVMSGEGMTVFAQAFKNALKL